MRPRGPKLLLRALVLAGVTLGGAAVVRAQQAERTIDPGMTRAQVVERLGKPKGARSAGEFTYLFYGNGCLKRCGIDDVVTLRNDAVVDAIFRGTGRHFTGTSSSPRALSPAAARGTRTRRGSGAASAGVITTTDSGAAAASAPGGLVIGSPAPTDSDALAAPAPRAAHTTRAARRTRRPVGARARARSARSTVPPIRLSPEDSAASVAPAEAARAAGIDSLRTGRRTTTGPVDAGAAVKNAGGRLFPSATPVTPSSGAAAAAAASQSAGRVPYQGSKLAPADSAAAVNARPRPAIPPKSDSTRPPSPPRADR